MGAAILFVALTHLKTDDRWVVAAVSPLMLALALLSKVRAEGLLKAHALYLVHCPS